MRAIEPAMHHQPDTRRSGEETVRAGLSKTTSGTKEVYITSGFVQT